MHGLPRELLDLGAEMNIVEKSGSWYSYGGERLGQGRENAKTFLIENPEVMVQMAEKVREQAGVNAAGAEAPAFTEKDDEPIDLD